MEHWEGIIIPSLPPARHPDCSLDHHQRVLTGKNPHAPAVKIPVPLIHLANRTSLLAYAVFLVHVPLLQFMEYIWPN